MILFLNNTQQIIHDCCDSYVWDIVDNDCVSTSFLFYMYEQNNIFKCFLVNKYEYKNKMFIFDIELNKEYSNSSMFLFFFAECSLCYTGVGCSIKCFHPLFGENCQSMFVFSSGVL